MNFYCVRWLTAGAQLLVAFLALVQRVRNLFLPIFALTFWTDKIEISIRESQIRLCFCLTLRAFVMKEMIIAQYAMPNMTQIIQQTR
jgi:hypothetical protein